MIRRSVDFPQAEGAEQGQELAIGDVKVDPRQDWRLAKALGDGLKGDRCHRIPRLLHERSDPIAARQARDLHKDQL
ncbi:MAG: hypothetical protein AAF675_06175 [Pseudomonadota bacterium]